MEVEPGVGGVASSFRSILDKPLSQLTEEDISQVTREDCRKYLKEKGMRRPSWNKSQAIQQVISLKALLETADDSGAGALRRILVSKPLPPPPATELSGYTNVAISDDNQRFDSPKSVPPVAPMPDCRAAEAANDNANAVPRAMVGGSASPAGQMTIFYCGKVNVYEGVPPDKARTIMHLAASPVQPPLDDPVARNASFSCPSPVWSQNDEQDVLPHTCMITPAVQTEKVADHPQICREKGNISVDLDVEGQASRKVSLQRYLEKKRERGKSKGRKSFGTPGSSLEMYLKVHQARTQSTSGQSTRSSTGSPTQPGANNLPKFPIFSVDLNEEISILNLCKLSSDGQLSHQAVLPHVIQKTHKNVDRLTPPGLRYSN